MLERKINVAAYCRVSTDKDDQANSLDNQKTYFDNYIANHPEWNLVNIYYDEGISGTSTKKRVSFNKMIQDAMDGKIDLILTKEVSRFARNTVDTLDITRKLKEHNVGVYFLLDNINTFAPDGELRLTIMSGLAQDESRRTSERVKFGQKRQMEKGVVFGRDLLGYTVKNGQLFIKEEEANTVRLIFQKYAIEKKGTHVIARELKEAGIQPKRGSTWSNTVILRVVRNEKYVGDLLQKKTYTANFLDHKKRYNRGNEEQVFIANHHRPIIDRDLWNLAQAELERRKPTEEMRRKHSNRYWNSGKLVCGECGSSYITCFKTLSDGTKYRAFTCNENKQHGSKHIASGKEVGCNCTLVKEESILYCVKECLMHLKVDKNKITREILSEIESLNHGAKNVNAVTIQKQISNLQVKKEKAFDSYLGNVVDEKTYRNTVAKYDEELEKLNQQLNSIHCQKNEEEMQKKKAQVIEREIQKVLSFEGEQEELYKEVIERITIFSNRKILIKFMVIPYEFEIEMSTKGKGKSFKTCINSMKINYQKIAKGAI